MKRSDCLYRTHAAHICDARLIVYVSINAKCRLEKINPLVYSIEVAIEIEVARRLLETPIKLLYFT